MAADRGRPVRTGRGLLRRRHRSRGDDGMATVELVAALPVLILITGALLSALVVIGDRVQVQDAAREAARLAARGDSAHAHAAASELAPGVSIDIGTVADEVRVRATRRAHLLVGWLPPITITATAVAAVEPSGHSP